ncbi:MAG: c-type cytochrome [Candidatus Binataceae bacterium]
MIELGGCAKRRASDVNPVAAGRQTYIANCASCHNPDPALEGPLGPPVIGASRELLEARILRQAYPPGYEPKRPTHLMRAMPWLAPRIGDLAAFLAAAQKKQK